MIVLLLACAAPEPDLEKPPATPPQPAAARRIDTFAADTCADDRLPALAGEWVVGCRAGDRPDTAVSLATGAIVDLPSPPPTFTLSGPHLFAPGLGQGPRDLPGGAPDPAAPFAKDDLVAPAAFDGVHIALATESHVEAYAIEDRNWGRVEARPTPGFMPALVWPTVVWVQAGAGLDLWTQDAAGLARPFRTGPGDQTLPVGEAPVGEAPMGEGRHLAWVDDGDVVLYDTRTQTETRFAADTGFGAPPTLADGVVCWEDRGAWKARGGALDDPDGIDIRCSDGTGVGGPGDQRWPSRWGQWLMYRVGAEVFVVGPG